MYNYGFGRRNLTNTQWEKLNPLLPPQKPKTGRPNLKYIYLSKILNGNNKLISSLDF
jgi:hypothetical protein